MPDKHIRLQLVNRLNASRLVCLHSQLPHPLAEGPIATIPTRASLPGDTVPGSRAQPATNSDAAAGEGAGALNSWPARC
jgi:hypothetical protein